MPRRFLAGPTAVALAALAALAVAASAGAFVVPFQAPATAGRLYRCTNTHGLKVAGRLPVHFTIQAIKGGRPTAGQLSCNRAYAVVKAGFRFLGANSAKSLGKTVKVGGDAYTYDRQPIGQGASGPTYAFAGASTVINLQIPTGA
jgi:hypothetical protein